MGGWRRTRPGRDGFATRETSKQRPVAPAGRTNHGSDPFAGVQDRQLRRVDATNRLKPEHCKLERIFFTPQAVLRTFKAFGTSVSASMC